MRALKYLYRLRPAHPVSLFPEHELRLIRILTPNVPDIRIISGSLVG
jgi:hypothetical protein